MSKMIPQESIDALRTFNDVSVENFGIDCDLYIPKTTELNQIETYDIYGETGDVSDVDASYTYNHYSTKIWIEWSPNARRLRKFGIFTEDEIPILARFKESVTNDEGDAVNVDIGLKSYVKVAFQFVPGNYSDTDEFEIVDILLGAMHDAMVSKIYRLTPRRA